MKIIKVILPNVEEPINALVVFELENDVKIIYAQNRICLYKEQELISGIHIAKLDILEEYAKNEEFDKILEEANILEEAKNSNYEVACENIKDLIKSLSEIFIETLNNK